ncbi:MAG: hypothetical protein AB7P52_17790 [Alphaproteobacteria bacterium]
MIQEVIQRLKDQVPPPALRAVEGAAEFAALDDRGAPQAPQAWVIPLTEAAGENRMVNIVAQTVRAEIAVVLAFRHVGDARGEAATLALEALRTDVRRALQGWAPEGHTPLELVGSALVSYDDGIVWWQTNFRSEFEARSVP